MPDQIGFDLRTGGTIKKLANRWGLITPDDGGLPIFFLASGLDSFLKFDDLNLREHVTFVVIEGEKGPRALDIRRGA